MEFSSFNKIPRLNREMVVTEKIDGTNAQISIVDCQDPRLLEPTGALQIASENGMVMFAGSRNKWITPGKLTDNFGFAHWAQDNASELFKLGIGTHFGEWWGAGIGRRYGLTEKRFFSLFNAGRWHDSAAYGCETIGDRVLAPACCKVVPILLEGPFSTSAVDIAVKRLAERGSYVAPGFMDPEGVIVWHAAASTMFKVTCKNDEKPKGSKEVA